MPSTSSLNSRQLARRCAEAALDKKAEHLEILDLRGLSSFTDFFVVASGNSEPHLKAIAQGVEEALRKDQERRPSRVDGFPMSQWVVMDYGDVLVHLFHEKKRGVYALEDLWGDAPRLSLDSTADEARPTEQRPTQTEPASPLDPSDVTATAAKAPTRSRKTKAKAASSKPANSKAGASPRSSSATDEETTPSATKSAKPRAAKPKSEAGVKRTRPKATESSDS